MLKLVQPSQHVFDRRFDESADRQAEDRAWVSGGDPAEERKQLDAMIPQLLPAGMASPGHIFRVAQIDGGADVAFVWFGAVPGMPEGVKLLFDICVDPAHRRQGHARAILTQMLEAHAEEDTKVVLLNARGDNTAALALYESLGFERSKTSEDGKQIEMQLRL